MRPTPHRTAVLVLTLAVAGLAASGCANAPTARYVYQDGQFGVIGVPMNTSLGRDNYLAQAHELMTRHFPDGYEIVRAEEVVEGQRFLDAGKKTELQTEPTLSALNQMIKLGQLSSTKSFEQKDTLPILECRIIYKRRVPGERVGSNGFSALASLKPEFYLDPNEMTRCKSLEMIASAKKTPDPPKPGDPAVQQADHRVDPSSTSTSASTSPTTTR
jgi:hypothetical protein